jgi:hypothetical protein
MKECPGAMQDPSQKHEEAGIQRAVRGLAQKAKWPVDALMIMAFRTHAHTESLQCFTPAVYSVLMRMRGEAGW